MTTSIGFGIVAACALLSAFYVVRSDNLIRAAMWLGVTLLATAALYAMLDASFLAAVQVLLYVGGVITLMIFGIMMTRRHDGIVVSAESKNKGRGVVVAVVVFGLMAAAIRKTEGLDAPPSGSTSVTAADLGRGLFKDHVLAFEVISLLLLAAIIGAIVIARRRDPGEPPKVPVRAAGGAVKDASGEAAQ